MHGLRCGATQSATPTDHPPDYPAGHGPTRNQQRKSWADQQIHYARTPDDHDQRSADPTATPIRGSRLSAPLLTSLITCSGVVSIALAQASTGTKSNTSSNVLSPLYGLIRGDRITNPRKCCRSRTLAA